MRSVLAGINLIEEFAKEKDIIVDTNTLEPLIVITTNVGYPSYQCRLDTYFAGALCGVDIDAKQSFNMRQDYKSACLRSNNQITGARGLCVGSFQVSSNSTY